MRNKELKGIRKRLPAEWEEQEAVLMAWPHPDSDWGYIIREAREQFASLISAMMQNGERVLILSCEPEATYSYLNEYIVRHGLNARHDFREDIIQMEHNDTWTRDYGPVGVLDQRTGSTVLLDFGFNAWGLKFPANHDNQVNFRLRGRVLYENAYVDCRDFILEGGSIETDGKGTLLTTTECLLNPNRNPTYTKQEIERILSDRLGFDRFLWLAHGHIEGDDTDSHIDTLARLAPDDVIVYCGGDSEEMRKMEQELRGFTTRKGEPYKLVELPAPDPIYDEDGRRLAATYANYLVTPGAVYMPLYSQPDKDNQALELIHTVYPDRTVIGIVCDTLIKQGGSLHCSTMQLLPGSIKKN